MNLNVFTVEDAAKVAAAVKDSTKEPREIAVEGRDSTPGTTPQVSADDVYTQVLKFVPTPLIGLYLFAVNAALSAFSGRTERVALWIIFIVFLLAVFGFLRSRDVSRTSQILISLAAFVA